MSFKLTRLIGYSIIIAIIATPLLGIVACSSATTTQTLKSIQLSPNPSPILEVGLSLHFYAIGLYADSSSQDIGNLVNWSSSNINVATIDSSGSVTAVAIGTTYISAVLAGVNSPKIILTVVPSTVPLSTTLGIGDISGNINFEDNKPGNGVTVLLCQDNGGTVIDKTATDSDGNYGFYGVKVGTYWINVAVNNSYLAGVGIFGASLAVVKVTPNNTAAVGTITVAASIYVSSINNIAMDYPSTANSSYLPIKNGSNFTFSWTSVENTTNYKIKVSASNTLTNGEPGEGYSLTEETQANSIVWPQNASLLPYQYFCINITAYDGNTNMASNYANFTFSTGTTMPTSSN